MDFNLTEEQSMLRDTLASYLADRYAMNARRTAIAAEAGWRPEIWRGFAELGLLAAPFPEDLGGLGGGAVETMVIMEAFGKALVVEPYLGTVVIAGGFLQHSGHAQAAERIAAIAAGDAVYAFAHAEPEGRYNLAALRTAAARDGAGYVLNGRKAVVIGAPWADQLIVTARTAGGERDHAGVSVFIVDAKAAGVSRVDYPTVDGFRASDITFEEVRLPPEALVGPEGRAMPLIQRVIDQALAAVCAEGCGVLRRLHEDTLAYARQRRQFGQPIAAFQVLQHRMADMFIALEQATSMTMMATLKLSDDAERSKASAAARVHVGKACRFGGEAAVQIHGGMGVTHEMDIGQYFKRATMIDAAFGSTDHHLARYELLSLGQAA